MAEYKDEQRGTWYVSFHYYDWTGKNCRKVKRGFKTKREATEWERHFRMKEAADLDMTFEEFVQAYTRDMKPKLKHNTWLTKEHILRAKLLPYFKDKKMRDIRPKDIIQWQNEQISYRDEKGKPYAPTYLKTLQSELSALFNHAVRFYELKSNPVVKAGPLGKGKAEEMLFWTKEEYLKFIEAVKDKPYSYHAFQILYWCGLRIGELLALMPQDIDFDNKVIRITKSYQRLEGEANIRAIVQIKNNLAAFGHPKAFELSEDGFHWLGDYEITADEVLGGIAPKANKLEQAKRLLREIAETNNAMQSNEIFNLAEEQGISRRTLENAKKELGIKARRINNSWYWELDKIKPE